MDLNILNDKQKEAVLYDKGPLLIIAGAGSGKTRVITYKIAYLIENEVNPANILAITFTNKASTEMQERVRSLLGASSNYIWVSTFHKMCSLMLRKYIDKIGYSNNFSIYDTDDSKSLIRNIIKELDLDTKLYKEKGILSRISSFKNKNLTYEDMRKEAYDETHKNYAKIFELYESHLKNENALDFDDLLLKTVLLLKKCPDVLEYYNEKFKYILVDEYQDTNNIQFELVKLLSKKSIQLCVVGDDDQSIYKFRGADIENILSFEWTFPNTKVIKLEQNYRSTKNILDCANSVIAHNNGRKEKSLWTNNESGEKVRFKIYSSQLTESIDIISSIKQDNDYKNTVVLYRTNSQSRLFEEQCIKKNIPYKLVGGVNFYQRKEIKDILSYLRLLNNPNDIISFKRIINVPKRGIGATSIDKIENEAYDKNVSIFDCLSYYDELGLSAKTKNEVKKFYDMMISIKSKTDIKNMIDRIRKETNYDNDLINEYGEIEAKERIENLDEFANKAQDYMLSTDAPSLNEFLADVSLVADVDSYNENDDMLTLMTLHGSKGLEFNTVYLAGLVDGLFPSYQAITSLDMQDIEEERRLCYVGFTRAKKRLYLSSSKQRMANGTIQTCEISRFVNEIDDKYINVIYDSSTNDTSYEQKIGRNSSMYGESTYRKNNYIKFSSEPYDYVEKTKSKPKSSQLDFSMKNIQKIEDSFVLNYTVGDKVSHIKFGIGEVKEITDAGKDFEVTIDFEDYGIKKLFAAFAKLQKVQ